MSPCSIDPTASANQVAVSYWLETPTWGQEPPLAGPPVFFVLPTTSDDFRQDAGSAESQILRADRMREEPVQTSFSGIGGFESEFRYDDFDDVLQTWLFSDAWPAEPAATAVTDLIIGGTGTTLNSVAGDFAGIAAGAGEWLRVNSAGGQTGKGKIVTIDANDIVLKNSTLTDEGSGAATIDEGSMIFNGVTCTSLGIQKEHADLTSGKRFSFFPGAVVQTLTIGMRIRQIVTIGAQFVAKREILETTDSSVSITPTSGNPSFSGGRDVQAIIENGVSFGLQSFSLTGANNLQPKEELGGVGLTGVIPGGFDCSGSIEGYLDSNSLLTYERYIENQSSDIALVIGTSGGDEYVFDVPAMKLRAAQKPTPGLDEPVLVNADWSSFAHPTEAVMLRITRFSAP